MPGELQGVALGVVKFSPFFNESFSSNFADLKHQV